MTRFKARVDPMPENNTDDKVNGKWQVMVYDAYDPNDFPAPQTQDLTYEEAEQIAKDFNEDQRERLNKLSTKPS